MPNDKKPATRYIVAIIIVVCLTGLGIVSLIRDRIVNPYRYQVSFTAEGTVFAKPDIAQITLGVRTERKGTAVLAVQENTELMNEVVAKLKDLGIADKDIKTSVYSLNPSYDYLPEKGRSEIMGYELYQEVTVKVRELDKIGSVIEAATGAGANQVGSITFTIDEMDAIKQQAREEAVAKAKQKAEAMAEITGLKLGKLVNVYESEDAYPPLYKNYAADYGELGLGGAGAAPSIQTGENEYNLQVTLTYEVK